VQEVLVRNALSVGSGSLQNLARKMWRNTVVVAQGARELALGKQGVDADAVYLAGLLHNVGELALLRLYADLEADTAAPLDLVTISHDISRVHESVGARLLRGWGVSPSLCRLAAAGRTDGAADERRGRHGGDRTGGVRGGGRLGRWESV